MCCHPILQQPIVRAREHQGFGFSMRGRSGIRDGSKSQHLEARDYEASEWEKNYLARTSKTQEPDILVQMPLCLIRPGLHAKFKARRRLG